MEAIVTQINVYDKFCIGSQKFKRDIMITFREEGSDDFLDFFLTETQAKYLMEKLQLRLADNQKETLEM